MNEKEQDYLDSYDISNRSKLAIILLAFFAVIGIMALAGFGVYMVLQIIKLFSHA